MDMNFIGACIVAPIYYASDYEKQQSVTDFSLFNSLRR